MIAHVTHGHTPRGHASPEYRAWRSAKERTTYPGYHGYERYAGRGIVMCPEWLNDFPAFLAEVGPRPGPGYSLDRIDNDRGYEPGNVRWATSSEQARNRRSARRDSLGRWAPA